jgi:hypothetical protein
MCRTVITCPPRSASDLPWQRREFGHDQVAAQSSDEEDSGTARVLRRVIVGRCGANVRADATAPRELLGLIEETFSNGLGSDSIRRLILPLCINHDTVTDAWLRVYNGERPHDSLGRVPPLTFLPRPSSAEKSPIELSA